MKTEEVRVCLNCETVFTFSGFPSQLQARGKYCSLQCAVKSKHRAANISKSLQGHVTSPETKRKIGIANTGNVTPRIFVNGYALLYRPDHPQSNSHGRISEHRIVMEQFLGRYLRKDEHVHHEDENRLNNKIENLRVLTNSEHMRLHQMKRRIKQND